MTALLEQYTLSEIVTFIIFLALALKSVLSFFDWAHERVEKVFNREHNEINEKQQLERKLVELRENQDEYKKYLNDLETKINMLISSDKDSIKAYITKEHHKFCYEKKWIDDFSLDCLERRYQHYKKEGGNTFIDGFMQQLRDLPIKPPHQ